MKHKELTRPDIAKACIVNLSAVDRWLTPPDKVSHRKMPTMAVQLLKYMDMVGAFDIDSAPPQ